MKTFTKFSFLILCLLVGLSGQAQNEVLDSLISTLPSEQDTIRYKQLFKVAAEQDKTDREASLVYYQEAIDIATALNDTRKIAVSNRYKGVNYLYLSRNEEAKKHLEESTRLFSSLGDTIDVIQNNTNIALIYQRMNDYEKATEMYFKVIQDSENIEEWIEVIIAKVNMASLLIDQGSHQQALGHLNSIDKDYGLYIDKIYADQNPSDTPMKNMLEKLNEQEIAELAKAVPDLGFVQSQIPSIYINQGICYKNLELPDSAFVYLEKAIDFSGDNPYITSYAYSNLGEIYQGNENWDEALANFREALAGFKSIKNIRGRIFSSNNIGKALIEVGRPNDAKAYINQALELAKEVNFKEEIRDAYLNLSEYHAAIGRYQDAFESRKLFSEYRDSITNESRVNAIQEWETKYDTQKERDEVARLALENEIKTREQQNQLVIFIFGILALIGIGLFLYTRYRLQKQKELADYERETNQAMAKFVPMEYVRSLGRENIKDVELGDQVEKEVSVVFTDIRSFTTISEAMTPVENFQFVKQYVERMSPIIHRNGGFINQYLGDGIMAIFQNTPADALRACVEMQTDIENYNKQLAQENKVPIKVGMGMHTGMLVMGIIGDNERMDAAIISDTVNSAARMESLTKAYGAGIILSHESCEKLNAKEFVCRGLGEARVKGKHKPLEIYECLNNDSPEQLSLKTKSMEDFNKGVAAYFGRDFPKAKGIFQKIYDNNPEDLVVYSFIQRAHKFVEDQPLEGLKDAKYNKVN